MVEIGKSRRIMVVDDDNDILVILKKGLERNGFEVDTFYDPIQALEKFKPNYYDIILTDVKMPGLNGFELYRQIHKQDEKAKVFFLSAIDIYEHEVKWAFPNLDPNMFIHKPIGIKDLVQTIASC
jgi:DNA-binding response OmpR family regulator